MALLTQNRPHVPNNFSTPQLSRRHPASVQFHKREQAIFEEEVIASRWVFGGYLPQVPCISGMLWLVMAVQFVASGVGMQSCENLGSARIHDCSKFRSTVRSHISALLSLPSRPYYFIHSRSLFFLYRLPLPLRKWRTEYPCAIASSSSKWKYFPFSRLAVSQLYMTMEAISHSAELWIRQNLRTSQIPESPNTSTIPRPTS